MEISLCDFNNTGEAQIYQRKCQTIKRGSKPCRPRGRAFQEGEQQLQSLWNGKKWNLLEEKQGQCVKNSAPVGKMAE